MGRDTPRLPGPLRPSSVIGVDVVDRRHRRLRGLPKERTVRRILSPSEAKWVADSPDPIRDFWLHWGAKEAAFKAVTLLRGDPPTFAHARFEVALDDARVDYEGIRLNLELDVTADRLAVVARPLATAASDAWTARRLDAVHTEMGGAPLDQLREERFTARERDTVRGLPSALARLGVRREAARRMAIAESRLEVICPPGVTGRRPPYLHLDGRPLERVGISISHDGEWLAWGVAEASSGEANASDGP